MTFCSLCLMAQEAGKVHLKGRIVDENEEPVSLCMVRVEGTAIATAANLEGHYQLDFPTADSVVILYSMIGYDQRRRVLKRPKGNLTLHIVMHTSSKEMEELTAKIIQQAVDAISTAFTKDEVLRHDVFEFLYDVAARCALHAQAMAGVVVRDVLSGLTDEQLNKLVYDKVEPDLLWIRMNGSIVGASIGAVFYLLFVLVPSYL